MIAYKAFRPGLICLGYQFVMGLNVTDKANCRKNGFHSAENPLDCLSYYSFGGSEFYLVDAGGDIDEDGTDSKISCTELRILKQLSKKEFFLHALAYMVDHPHREWNSHVDADRATAHNGFAVVRGFDPLACGDHGDYLALAKENPENGTIEQIALAQVDGKAILPGIWYDINFEKRTVGIF
ncbi:hypothetical protein DPQ25_13670 [Hydrogeniiclostridium mannosilyticum]|uniref:DUF7666 domain-containing protein n=1 Tax=Hydrogeniiclostridium mannosilyticum TaxID=2764322 RepID=A0A328UFY9_9FIRM|nr:hypothetical protein [Hydrogeniiclostridium mannosilyticum]RAQ22132.1 hypothetical protein DPQ25_13670 [Hydrogeniiclostridium mannosilyticum]